MWKLQWDPWCIQGPARRIWEHGNINKTFTNVPLSRYPLSATLVIDICTLTVEFVYSFIRDLVNVISIDDLRKICHAKNALNRDTMRLHTLRRLMYGIGPLLALNGLIDVSDTNDLYCQPPISDLLCLGKIAGYKPGVGGGSLPDNM